MSSIQVLLVRDGCVFYPDALLHIFVLVVVPFIFYPPLYKGLVLTIVYPSGLGNNRIISHSYFARIADKALDNLGGKVISWVPLKKYIA
jgi:hypothetical protein